MKKLLSIILAVLMVVPSVFIVSAETVNLVETQEFCDAVNIYVIKTGAAANLFKQHLTDKGDGTYDVSYSNLLTPENVRERFLNIYKETESLVIFGIPGAMDAMADEKIGDYIFNANSLYSSENPCGYCVYTNGNVYGIADAVSQNIVTVEELAEVIPNTEYLPNDKIDLLQSFIDNGFNVSYAQILGAVDDCELCRAGYEDSPDAIGNVIIGNYLFATRGLYGDDNTGLYIKKNDVIYTLSDAYKQGVITDEQLDVISNILIQNDVFEIVAYKFDLDAEKAIQSHYQLSDTFSLLKICEIGDSYVYSNIGENEVGNYSTVELGDYIFTLHANQTPYNLGVYVISNEEVYTLDEAYNARLITDLSVIKDSMYEQSLINFNFSMEKKKDPVIIIPPVDEPKTSVTVETGKIKAGEKVNPFNIVNPDNEAVTFAAKNPEFATVNAKGVVTALQKGTAEFVVTVGEEEFTCSVKVTSDPKLMKNNKKVTSIKVNKNRKVKLQLVGKVKNIKNVYTNTKIAKITSGKNATTIKVKGLKKGTTTLKIKVNGVKTLKLKVTVK